VGYPTYTPSVTTVSPGGGESASRGSGSDDSGSGGESGGSEIIWPPLWPFGG
jgi:hypothetical protein